MPSDAIDNSSYNPYNTPIMQAFMQPEFLREIGEYAALGFYEGIDLPFPRAYGLAFRRLYENMPVRVPPGRRIIPHENLCDGRQGGLFYGKTGTRWSAFICSFNYNTGLDLEEEIAGEKKAEFPQHAQLIDALVEDLRGRLRQFGGHTHSNPDIRRVVTEGFNSMEAELDHELARAQQQGTASEINLLLAVKDYTIGIRTHYHTVLSSLRNAVNAATGVEKKELALIADSFANCFLTPSRTFVQGLLAVCLTWTLNGYDSIGRPDQVLGPLFEKDLASGALSLEFARRLIDEWWELFENRYGWNLQIGGRKREDGTDGCNELTREFILACKRNRISRPNVAFRITTDTPDSLVEDALDALANGAGRPALYNDDLYIRRLKEEFPELTDEDAHDYGFGGCTETMIAGLSNVGSLDGRIDLTKALELALFDGMDPMTHEQPGPSTGRLVDHPTFDSFLDALRKHITEMTKTHVQRINAGLERRFTEVDPKIVRTFFTRDCIKNRKSFEAGGARYNWSVVTYSGIATLIDSLSSLKHCVFDTGTVNTSDLLKALECDFVGYEEVQRLLGAAPRFGNDDDFVDLIGADILRFAWSELLSHRQARGGRFLPSCIEFTTFGASGRKIGATPDGRRAFTPLNDSVGAVAGRDVRGPTALLNSVLKLPLGLALGTPVLNIRFQKKTLTDATSRYCVVQLIKSFFERGGMQIQITVVNREDLLAARRNPEQYSDLIVRIGGFSAYFNRLDPQVQDSVIQRTEHETF